MMEPLKLSLATFQPDKCYPPYLNTPRSLEACRLNGINPLELVEIPFTEFQKDHPNDLDTANRRFERVDGARRRVYAAVMKDWRHLCETGWVPPETRPKRNKESIVDVPPSAHCQLLELQAEKFRKLEEENWMALNRNLRLEIQRADSEQRNNEILQKHSEIQNMNETAKKELQMKKDAQIAEQIQRQRDEEARRNAEIRSRQEESYQDAKFRLGERKANAIRERQMREKREADRVARDMYTKQMKDSILANMDQKLLQRQKLFEMREKIDDERVKETKERRARELEEKRRAGELRIAQAREDQRRHMADVHHQIMEKLAESERHREAVEEARRQNRQLTALQSDETNEHMRQIKEKAMQQVQEKAEATLKSLKLREELARQELEKVREAQERRRTIKALRQEAYVLSSTREKKKEEYRLAKVKKNLHDKEERLQAIRQGFNVLSTMRNSMKDIMDKTHYELKCEMDRLRHSSTFSPDRVVEKAMKVSKEVLFPRLEKTFGFAGEDDDQPTQHMYDPQSLHFSFDLGDRPNSAAGYEGDAPPSRERLASARSPTRQTTRTPAATLKIQRLGEDRLRNALADSMRRVEEMHVTGGTSRSGSPNQTHRSMGGSPSRDSAEHPGDEDGDDGSPPPAILRLPGELGESTVASSPSPIGKGLGQSRKLPPPGKYVGKSALAKSAGEDTKIPLFPFTAGAEFTDTATGKEAARKPTTAPAAKSSRRKLRNEVNDKAKFLPLPPGKFRREFSADHPLADGGRGKYSRELDQGLTPAGLPVEVATKPTSSVEDNVKDAVALAERVEKLTYEAQSSVVDSTDDIEKLRKEMNSVMKALLEEERSAEDERLRVLASMTDPQEKATLEQIFAEERRRASDKIVAATRDYDKTIRQAMLKSLNLGVAS